MERKQGSKSRLRKTCHFSNHGSGENRQRNKSKHDQSKPKKPLGMTAVTLCCSSFLTPRHKSWETSLRHRSHLCDLRIARTTCMIKCCLLLLRLGFFFLAQFCSVFRFRILVQNYFHHSSIFSCLKIGKSNERYLFGFPEYLLRIDKWIGCLNE